ncbi:hypothetical protein K8I85_17940 [bacterium]|nr:hypothetical protein [bacterium]
MRTEPSRPRRNYLRSSLLSLLPLLLCSSAGTAGGVVWGTRPGEVWVAVSVCMSDSWDHRIWHGPLASVRSNGDGTVALRLDGVPFELVAPAGSGAPEDEEAELVRNAAGELLRFEYELGDDVDRGLVRVCWSVTSRLAASRCGLVPMTAERLGDLLQWTWESESSLEREPGFLNAQEAFHDLLDHATNGSGRRVDELVSRFRAACDSAGIWTGVFRDPDGHFATGGYLTSLGNETHLRVAQRLWRKAVRSYQAGKPVNAHLNVSQEEWKRCTDGCDLAGPDPFRGGTTTVTDELFDVLRRRAIEVCVARAESSAAAHDVAATDHWIEQFRAELAAAMAGGAPFVEEEFIPEVPPPYSYYYHLRKRARGETGVLGPLRWMWHTITAEAEPPAWPRTTRWSIGGRMVSTLPSPRLVGSTDGKCDFRRTLAWLGDPILETGRRPSRGDSPDGRPL